MIPFLRQQVKTSFDELADELGDAQYNKYKKKKKIDMF